jgi:hypothetical protein
MNDSSDQFSKFDPDYVKNVIGPHLLVRTYQGERPLASHDRCEIEQRECYAR